MELEHGMAGAVPLCRCWRQGQEYDVDCWRLEGINSAIDDELRKTQNKKTKVNSDLMRPIIRRHDQEPVIAPLLTITGLPPLNYFG